MKKKNKKIRQSERTAQTGLSGKLKRHQEHLAKEEQKREKSRNALFRRRVREASEKKAPKTLRTKSYYRFAKDYPAAVNPDGFRENSTPKERLSSGKKLITAVLCIAVFFIGLIATETAIVLSEKDIADNDITEAVSTAVRHLSVHFSPAELKNLTAEEILSQLEAMGADTAVFEFKDEYGYVYFDINSFVGASADKIISDAIQKTEFLQKKGITCIAYISCFKDTVAASSAEIGSVKTVSGADFIDSSDNAWIDPTSEAAVTYLTGIIESAADIGFDSVLLDNICFPDIHTSAVPVFMGDVSSSEKKNTVLTDFIKLATDTIGKEKTMIMSLISGLHEITDIPSEKYGGLLTSSECTSYALDLRLSSQDAEITENSQYFGYTDEMPAVFILDAASLAVNSLSDKEGTLFSIIDSSTENADLYSGVAGINNIIYW